MKEKIFNAWRFLQFISMTFAVMWKAIRGGWFVYRDYPEWFVVMMKDGYEYKESVKGKLDDFDMNLLQQAREELSLRNRGNQLPS
jgi:hypothetical protein